MDDQPTCGKGLAANAPLPDQLGRVVAATAAVLEAHLAMLDVSDPHSAKEQAVYVGLVEEHRRAAQVLRGIAQRMAEARELPMGRHLDAPGADAEMCRAFAGFVVSETALHAALEARLAQDQAMLAAMREASSARQGVV
jgi:hypothetical protein